MEAFKLHQSFNPWYVGGGVKRVTGCVIRPKTVCVSILGMLEGVLKAFSQTGLRLSVPVSILGMLEGVLKEGQPQVLDTALY